MGAGPPSRSSAHAESHGCMDHEGLETLVADLGFALRWDLPNRAHGDLAT